MMKTNGIYELTPIYDTRASFYGKAQVNELEDELVKNYLLYSYNTLVAIYSIDKKTSKKVYNFLGRFSSTTTRHQKEFFKQNGLNDDEIKKLFKEGTLEL